MRIRSTTAFECYGYTVTPKIKTSYRIFLYTQNLKIIKLLYSGISEKGVTCVTVPVKPLTEPIQRLHSDVTLGVPGVTLQLYIIVFIVIFRWQGHMNTACA